MRAWPILSAVLLTAATPLFAQVTIDLHALQALPDHRAAGQTPRASPSIASLPAARPTAAPTPGPTATPAPITSTLPTPVATATPTRVPALLPPAASATTGPIATREQPGPAATPAPRPAMPEDVPATASLTPIAPPTPAAGSKRPAAPPVSATAATAAVPTPAGLRVTFAAGESDLSPDSIASIKQLTATIPSNDTTTFNVLAYAPGRADDPSTARRMSLSRAMAVRSALVADGVPSARIFVRALGEQYGDGPPDRVDLSVLGANAPAPSTATPATAAVR